MRSTLTHYTNPRVNTNSWQDLVATLVAIRNKRGYSQEELAHRIGCAASLIHKWEQYKGFRQDLCLSAGWMRSKRKSKSKKLEDSRGKTCRM